MESAPEQSEIRQLIRQWKEGDQDAERELIELIYPHLYQEAKRQRRKHQAYLTLNTGDIANEAVLKLADLGQLPIKDQLHLQALTAQITRNLVIDYIRKRHSQKRGGNLPFVSIEDAEASSTIALDGSIDWIGVQECIEELRQQDQICAEIIELKFFSTMTYDEISQHLECSKMTVRRKWYFAKSWLSVRLKSDRQILKQ